MPPTQSSDPRDRMGIYKQLCDVPSEKRLKTYEDQYVGEQTYTQFLQTFYLERFNTKRSVEKVELAGRRWREHMEARGRHHALAMPSDVEEWMKVLLEKVSLNTAFELPTRERMGFSVDSCSGRFLGRRFIRSIRVQRPAVQAHAQGCAFAAPGLVAAKIP